MSAAIEPVDAELPSSAELSADELAEAKRYGRHELWCDLADKAIDVGFLAIMAFSVAPLLREPLQRELPYETLRLAAYLLITMFFHMAVSFPLSYYSGHVLEHKFGLSQLSFSSWLGRYAKRMTLTVLFGLLLFVGLYWVIWIFGKWWWAVAATSFFFVSVLVGQLLPVVVLPLFYKITRLDEPELTNRLTRLAEGTGLSIEGAYRMDLSSETTKANAMLAGLGRTRRVLMGDTVLDGFTPDEIEVIFAHEIGHHVHRHIHKMILMGVVYSTTGFWLCDRIVMSWARWIDPTVDYANFPVFTLPLMMLVLTCFSLFLEPLQNIVSRRYERQCDRYALERTGLRAAYITAFRKLARLNKDDPNPNPLEVFLFHSHPPINERLAMADE
jgi:STE24 endopeptidase